MRPTHIEARSYDTKVVNHRLTARPKPTANSAGVWNVKYKNFVPEHVAQLVRYMK